MTNKVGLQKHNSLPSLPDQIPPHDAERVRILQQMILKQRVICGITAPMIEAELVLATGVWHEFLEDIPTERLLSTFHDAVKSAKDKREVGVVLVLRTFHQSRRAAEVEHYISASEYLNPAREADNARL